MVINGITYSEEELDVLRRYTGRKSVLESKKRNPLANYLGINSECEDINIFLGVGKIPITITTGLEFKNFINDIETLYRISCKFGSTNEIENAYLYREEERYNDIVGNFNYKTDVARKRVWVTNSFKSFSKTRGEASAFSRGEFSSHMVVVKTSKAQKKKKVPFIDVNKLLGSSHLYASEEEIIFPPFLEFNVFPEASIVPRGTMSYNSSINDFNIDLTENMRNPYTVINQRSDNKKVPLYSTKNYGVTDCEFDLYVELYRKKNLSENEKIVLIKLQNKIQNYIMTRCSSIRTLYMDDVLVVGKYITKKGMKHFYESQASFDENNLENIVTTDRFKGTVSNIGFGGIGDFSSSLTYLYESATPSYSEIDALQTRGAILPTVEVTKEMMLDEVLYGRENPGNKELTEMLASKGFIMDDVLAVGRYITPKGVENSWFVYLAMNEKSMNDNIILTVNDMNDYISRNKNNYDYEFRITLRDLIEDKKMQLLSDDNQKYLKIK